jgi:hypothetical protein
MKRVRTLGNPKSGLVSGLLSSFWGFIIFINLSYCRLNSFSPSTAADLRFKKGVLIQIPSYDYDYYYELID